MFKHSSLKWKLIVSFLGVGVIVLLVGLVGFKGAKDLNRQVQELGELELKKVEHLLRIRVEFEKLKGVIASFLNPALTDEEREFLYKQIQSIRERYNYSKNIYASLFQTEEEKKEWQNFVKALKEWKEADDQYFEMAKKIEESKIKNPLSFWASLEKYKGYHYFLLNKTLRMLLSYRKFKEGSLEECPFTSWLNLKLKINNPTLNKILVSLNNNHVNFHLALEKVKNEFKKGDLNKAKVVFTTELYPKAEEVFFYFDKAINYAKKVKDSYALMISFKEEKVQSKMKNTFYHLDRLVEIVSNNAINKVKLANNNSQKVFIFIVVGIGIGIILAFILGILLSKTIISPLKKTVFFAQEIVKGNLNASLDLKREDEIGILIKALKNMIDSLKQKIEEARLKSLEAQQEKERAQKALEEAEKAREAAERAKKEGMLEAAKQISEVVEALSTASEELSSQIEQTLRGAEMSKNLVAESATAMEEMNTSVLEVAKNTSGVAKDAEDSQEKAKLGADIVKKVIERISGVKDKEAKASKENISLLGEKVKEIDSIINVIEDIADQTNLLALNAAIEAARAGEAGRGFAVVADEVRKLAEKTMNATKEVGGVIAGIQSKTLETVKSVDILSNSISKAAELATQSGKALEEIVSISLNVASQIQAIATATEEQSATSEEITRNISEVNQITQEATQAMQESSRALLELANLAQKLQNLIQKMKEE